MNTNAERAVQGRVLVVDDDHDICALIADALDEHGYEVETATSGEAALRAVGARRPDLVMLDVNMPGIDGWDVLNELRAAAGDQTPVVVMTAGFDAQERALATGAQGYLSKPFDLDDLQHAVGAHIGLPMQGSHELARGAQAEGR